jgi:acyl-CoA synthetase (AMP-forming)/AMP-acid ligase II
MAKTACVACAHPKWDERPLLVAVSREGIVVSTRQVLDFFSGKVAKWCVPDDDVVVDDLPLTGTGKVQKLMLRQRFSQHFVEAVTRMNETQFS